MELKDEKPKRKGIGNSLRFKILERDNFECTYCGADKSNGLEVDHIVPVSRGGTNEPINLTTSCIKCNRGKFTKSLNDPARIHATKKETEIQRKEVETIKHKIAEAEEIAKAHNEKLELEKQYLNLILKTSLTDYGVENVKRAIDKHSESLVREYWEEYQINDDWRRKNGYRVKTLSAFVEDKENPDYGKKLQGLVRNVTSKTMLTEFCDWMDVMDDSETEEFYNRIRKKVKYGAYINQNSFRNLWHSLVRSMWDVMCCDMHEEKFNPTEVVSDEL